MTLLLVSLSLAATPAPAPAPTARPKLIVLELVPAGGVPAELASAMTEAIATEISQKRIFDVVSSKDFATLLGMERQKATLGCGNDSSSCLSELAGALGARFVLSGSLAKLGDTYQLSLQTLDSAKAQPMGRSTRLSKDLASLRAQLPYTVAEATATPLPPPPSHLLPYSLMGAGALGIIGGGLLTLKASSDESALRQELQLAQGAPQLLSPVADYTQRVRALDGVKTGALVAFIAGAALVAGGVVLNPWDSAGAGPSLAMLPGGGLTVGVAGVLR